MGKAFRRRYFAKAIAFYEQAITRDPKVPRSLIQVWLTVMSCFRCIFPLPQRDAMAKAQEAALKALQIDPNLAEAHNALGKILNFDDLDLAGAAQGIPASDRTSTEQRHGASVVRQRSTRQPSAVLTRLSPRPNGRSELNPLIAHYQHGPCFFVVLRPPLRRSERARRRKQLSSIRAFFSPISNFGHGPAGER